MKNLIIVIVLIISGYSFGETVSKSPMSNYVELNVFKVFKEKGKGFNYRKHRRKMKRQNKKRRKNCKPSSQR